MPSGGSSGDKGTNGGRTEPDSAPTEKTPRSEKTERSEKSEKTEKAERGERTERSEKHSKTEKSDKTERTPKETKSGTTGASGGTGSNPGREATAAPGSATSAAPRPSSATSGTKAVAVKSGLSEDALSQVAQAKFEAQEDKLRDVARYAMAFLRDFPKLGPADCAKKVSEIRKALVKYEMQYLRVCELQERRRRIEIKNLEAEAARCREEAEKEASGIVALREALEKERRRRKRYEGYEDAAAEVNKKKTRTDSQAEIDGVTQHIAELRQQHSELDSKIEERNRRAQLLRHAAAELAADLRAEREASGLSVETPGQSNARPEEEGIPGQDGSIAKETATVELIS